MRNAEQTDLKWLSTNVMYLVEHKWFLPFKAHIKQPMLDLNDGWVDPWLVETVEGSLLVVERSWLKAVPRKVGAPAKAKRRPQKGTKPWLGNKQYVPYDSKLIAVGTKVLTKCGKEFIITEEYGDYNNLSNLDDYWLSSFHLATGKNRWDKAYDIVKIVVKDSAKQHSAYNGYSLNTWHFWQGNTNVPPVDSDVKVQYWMRSDEQFDKRAFDRAKDLRWKWNSATSDGDIIAFRIVE